MNLLVIYPYIPWPLDRGTYQRTYHLLRALATEHTVDLLALSENGERVEHQPVFEAFCRNVRFVPFQHPQWPSLAKRLLCPTPTSVQHWNLPVVRAAIDEALAAQSYDAVYVCDIVMAQYFLDQHRGIPLIIDRSRVDLQFQFTQLRLMSKGLRNRINDFEAVTKTWLFERRVAARATLQVVCGPDDKTFIRKHICGFTPIKVLANGVDLQFFHPRAVPDARDAKPTVLFCGAMDYTPNIDALRWYFAAIHESLRQEIPSLQVLIVGKTPVPEVQAYGSRPGVTVTGSVPDVRPYYRRAWVQIVPLRIGGGTRLKIAESLAIGTPVVSTTIGAQGLDLVHGEDILLADTAADFAAKTALMLTEGSMRASIMVQGLATAQERLAWPMLGRDLNRALASLPIVPSQPITTPLMSPSKPLMGHVTSPVADPHAPQPPICILGLPFDGITTSQTVAIVERMIESRQPHYIVTANVDFIVQGADDLELRHILHHADLVVCDGQPLVWASRLLGNPLPERVAGSDLVPQLLDVAEEKGHRVFFLGGAENVLQRAVEKLRVSHPRLEIAGTLSPKFQPLLEMDHAAICETIRASRADILLVAFGCPKQEKWISMNYRHLGVPVSIGVGATIDFLAGAVRRAPRWVQRAGFEWSWRIAQEPRRLFHRYFRGFLHFVPAILTQIGRLRLGDKATDTRSGQHPESLPGVHIVSLPNELSIHTSAQLTALFHTAQAAKRPVLVDGCTVTTVDSTGLAMLSRMHSQIKASGQSMVLANASPPLLRGMRLMRLDSLIEAHLTTRAAAEALHERTGEITVNSLQINPQQGSKLSWSGEVTASNVKEVWTETNAVLTSLETLGEGGTLTIDLSGLRFIDSSGVGLMLRARKRGQVAGVTVLFTQPSTEVIKVLRSLNMERVLLTPPVATPSAKSPSTKQRQAA